MSAHRTHRSDSNAEMIINALRGQGCSVFRINPSGGRTAGLPDLLIGIDAKTVLAEVKVPGGKLTPDQKLWHMQWRGSTVWLLQTLEDVGSLVKYYKGSK
jgi:hypothetical protein